MRGSYSAALRDRTERTDPTAKILVDALIVGGSDIKQRKDQWDLGTGASGFNIDTSGRVTIQGVNSTLMDQTVQNADETRITRAEPFYTGEVLWSGTQDAGFEITDIDVTLDALATSTVQTWVLEIWAVLSGTGSALSPYQLAKISESLPVAATAGGGPQVVTFNYSNTVRPRPKAVTPTDGQTPKSFFSVVGFAAGGAIPIDVAQRVDTGNNTFPDAGNVLAGRTLQFVPGGYVSLSGGSVPRIRIRSNTFSADTLTFSGANQYDLSSAPTDDVEVVEIVGEPTGTTVAMQVDANVATPFTGSEVTVQGGDFLNATHGLPIQKQYAVRYTLTPTTSVSPVLWTGGLQETQRDELGEVADVRELEWSIPDPFTGKARIPEAQIALMHYGQPDKEDLTSRILSENTIGKLRFRIFWGDTSIPRAQWMVFGVFEPDGYVNSPGGKLVTAMSPLQYLRGVLPQPKEDANQRWNTDPFVVASGTAIDVAYQNVLAEAPIPAQYIGAGIAPGSGLTVGATIEDSDIKANADALALIADYVVVDRQGRIAAVPFDNSPPVHTFRRDAIQMVSADPGYRDREAVVFVKWAYNVNQQKFTGLNRSASALGVTELGEALINKKTYVAETVSRWIEQTGLDGFNLPVSTTADQLGARLVQTFGFGKMVWRWRATIAAPHLEIGDRVIVETHDFVAPDPSSSRALRGNLWAIARVVETSQDGQTFAGLIESYADIFAGTAPGSVGGAPYTLGFGAHIWTDVAGFAPTALANGARSTTNASPTQSLAILTLPPGAGTPSILRIRVWYQGVINNTTGPPAIAVTINDVDDQGGITPDMGSGVQILASTAGFVEFQAVRLGPPPVITDVIQVVIDMTPGHVSNVISFSNVYIDGQA